MKTVRHIKIIVILIFALATNACTRENQQQFEIHGKITIPDMEGSLIYLAGLEGNTLVYADSTVISDSTFVFVGIQDKPQLKFLIPLRRVSPSYAPKPFILENGRIEAVISDSSLHVTGTPLNDELNKYRQKKIEFESMKKKLDGNYKDSLRKMTKEMETEFLTRYKAIEKAESDYVVNLISKNNDNVLGGYIMLENRYTLSNAQKQAILSDAPEEFFSLDGITSIDEALKRRNSLNTGKKIPDIKLLNSSDGELHSLSEYAGKGNILVINIWASWSAPSVAAIYDIKALAKKYSRKGVEVLSISIDTVQEQWRNAIKKNEMNWTNLADLKGWNSKVATLYQINSIPSYMLINTDGSIIISESTLEEVDSKLNRLLNN